MQRPGTRNFSLPSSAGQSGHPREMDTSCWAATQTNPGCPCSSAHREHALLVSCLGGSVNAFSVLLRDYQFIQIAVKHLLNVSAAF